MSEKYQNVSMKDTKQTLKDAVDYWKTKYDELTALKDDPVTKAEKIKAAEQTVQVQDLVINHSELLSPELVAQFKAFESELQKKKNQIRQVYGIEIEANTMAAMISAHKVLEQETKDKFAAMNKELQEKHDALVVEKNNEIKALEAQKKEILDATRAESVELEKKLKQDRKRAEEEYEYDLKRTRKLETDKWEDEKAAREKELKNRENIVTAKAEEINAKIDEINAMEAKVADLTNQVKVSYEQGKKDGKAEADKSNAFEVRALKKENEFDVKTLQAKLDAEATRADKAEAKANELQNKLDEAYAQMRQLAADTVKSSGGVKILNNTEGK